MSSKVLKKHAAAGLAGLGWKRVAPSVALSETDPAEIEAGGAPAAAHPARPEQADFERGRREGEAAARQALAAQFRSALDELAKSAAALAAYKPALRHQAERELLALALAIARKILRRELTVDPNIVLAVVRSCLEELRNAEIYRLRLNPQDLETVAASLPRREPPIQVVADAALTRGGAIFESSQGQLDARLEAQLQEIECGLADRYA